VSKEPPGGPTLLFEAKDYPYMDAAGSRNEDITPDGKRFLMVVRGEEKPQPVTELIFVQNWLEELKRLYPTGKRQVSATGPSTSKWWLRHTPLQTPLQSNWRIKSLTFNPPMSTLDPC